MIKEKLTTFFAFSENNLNETLNYLSSNKSKVLVLADEYNYENTIKKQKLKKNIQVLKCESASEDFIRDILNNYDIQNVIAVGGCSTLDVGRVCALHGKRNKRIIAIPTILSTSCISVSKAILYDNERNKITYETYSPILTLVPLEIVKNTEEKELIKWNNSGIGDMIADISAVLDFLYKKGKLNKGKNIYSLVKETFKKTNVLNIVEVVEEINSNFKASERTRIHKNEKFLEDLSKWLHKASILSNRYKEISAGSEHEFYYAIFKNEKFSTQLPTHGQLVAIGTLINSKILAKYFKEESLYLLLREVYMKIGLPTTYRELKEINVDKKQIIKAIETLKKEKNKKSLLVDFFTEEILDEVFG